MNASFSTLFTLSVSHGFYTDGRSRDFDFVLPRDTVTSVSRGRLLTRVVDGVLHVLFLAAADGSPVASLAGETLRIGLRLQNPSFFNFTADPGSPAGAIARYRNGADPATLDAAEAVDRKGSVFSHTVTSAVRPLTVTLTSPQGRSVASATIAAGDESTSVSFDVTGVGSGAFTLQEADAAPVTCYVDPELAAAPAFAVVEIAVDASFYTEAPAFDVPFEPAEDTLKYYLVVRDHSESEIASLSVSDAGADEQSRDAIAFTRVDTLTGDDLSGDLLTGGDEDATAVLFKSSAAVARRQDGLKRIQLSRNGEVLIGNLPQPAGRGGADLIVHVRKS